MLLYPFQVIYGPSGMFRVGWGLTLPEAPLLRGS
jgi:hypothetical protein